MINASRRSAITLIASSPYLPKTFHRRERPVYYRYIDKPAHVPVFVDQLRRNLNFANARSLKLLPGDDQSVVFGRYGPQVVTISGRDGEVSPPKPGPPDTFNLFNFADLLKSSSTASITQALAEMQGPLIFTEDGERLQAMPGLCYWL